MLLQTFFSKGQLDLIHNASMVISLINLSNIQEQMFTRVFFKIKQALHVK